MIYRSMYAAISVLILTGCGSWSDDQTPLLAEARAINVYPVKRQELISRLSLEGSPSQRLDGSVRGGRMSFTESWKHRSGLTVTAFDSEYVGELKIIPGNIDHILDGPSPVSGNGPNRASFEKFVIRRGDAVLYRSDRKQSQQDAALKQQK